MGAVRRHPVLAGLLALGVLAAVAAGALLYVVLEERRLARAISDVLARRTGLPIAVERATTDGWRLTLKGVRLAAGPHSPLDLRAAEVRLTGGLLPLLAPEGRPVSITIVSAVVVLPPS